MNSNLAYREDLWEERIDGKIVAMSPRPTINHSKVAAQIYWLFQTYLRGRSCSAFADGVELHLSKKDIFIPDMMVVCDPDKIREKGVYGPPDLVVEVLSPGTTKRDRGYKMLAYQKHGVREYWIVTPDTRTIERYLLREGAFVLEDTHVLYPDYDLEEMTPEERAAALAPFKCSLFDDLEIDLKDIFDGLLRNV